MPGPNHQNGMGKDYLLPDRHRLQKGDLKKEFFFVGKVNNTSEYCGQVKQKDQRTKRELHKRN